MAIGFGAWQFIFCIVISLICAATVIVQSLLVKSAAISVMAERIEVQDDTDKKFEKGI